MFVSFCTSEKELLENILRYLVLREVEREPRSGQASQDGHSLGLFLPGTRVNIVRIDQTRVQEAEQF